MFHIFFLLASLAGGSQQIGVSDETYDTKEACQAKIEERVAKVDSVLNPKGGVVVAALCDTEEGFKAKMQQKQNDSI